jgi:PAS domain S-box-containing protein
LVKSSDREELIKIQFQLYERSHSFMLVLSGPELRFEFANPTFLRLVGEQDVVGRRFVDVFPDIDPEYLHLLALIRQTKKVDVLRSARHVLNKDGLQRTFYIDLVSQPLIAEDGSVEAVFIEGYDVTAKVETEQRLKLVAQEVDHRANNLLAVIQSIVALSRGDSAETLRRNILGRINALGRTHQLLSQGRWRGAELKRLVEEELLPYTLGDAARMRLSGPAMDLTPGEAQALAMGLHELATNAAKYGALSTPDGRVEVTWSRDTGGARRIRWQEDGGPLVEQPSHKGLGMSVLERTLQGAIGGRTQLLWRPEGLVCEFGLPPERPEDEPEQLPLAEAG